MIQGFTEIFNGTETLTQAIYKDITDKENVRIRFNTKVSKVVNKNNMVALGFNDSSEELFDRVVLTTTPRAASFIQFEPRYENKMKPKS